MPYAFLGTYRKVNPLQSVMDWIVMVLAVPLRFYPGILLRDVARFLSQM